MHKAINEAWKDKAPTQIKCRKMLVLLWLPLGSISHEVNVLPTKDDHRFSPGALPVPSIRVICFRTIVVVTLVCSFLACLTPILLSRHPFLKRIKRSHEESTLSTVGFEDYFPRITAYK
jgi:hypothetical protein